MQPQFVEEKRSSVFLHYKMWDKRNSFPRNVYNILTLPVRKIIIVMISNIKEIYLCIIV